ncbi:MAG: DUF1887 family protein [Symplocastrum torsivum CPER-KK1]|jgi:hypothetical protein|uniref:DUF1887 family protein n=1 Tax=Symplocastrum torsivum CPER-KK1 TaxID=450513 RepID=A0A951PNU1_9CYAN|nr:DUF1887 family protein [Symplocastrum torsivum CPER-KK1]
MTTAEPYYKVDHLFLLVGENPLPNYIAAKMLLKKGGTIYLVHSTDTASKADCIGRMLEPINVIPISLGRNEANSCCIRDKIQSPIKEVLKKHPGHTFGLNYTGGTKAMSVHGYRALFEVSGVQNPRFSYLDARSLQMLIDRDNDSPNPEPVTFKLLLQEIFDLHELHLTQDPVTYQELLETAPELAELHPELAKLHTDINLAIAWRWWCDNILKPAVKVLKKKQNKPLEWEWKSDKKIEQATVALTPDVAIRKLDESLQEYIKQPEDGKPIIEAFKKHNYKLVEELVEFYKALWIPEYVPHIERIIKVLRDKEYLGESEIEVSLKQFAEKGKFDKSKYACQWLDGLWLEHYVLSQVQEVSKKNPGLIHDSGMTFKVEDAKKEKFEFDVAFTKDYQLFALSCTTDATKPLCKSKLFEAYIRTRQLGGEQARVALVCCYNDPKQLEAELKVETEIEKEDPKIAVFGCKELDNLQVHIKGWIEDNNRYYAP